MPNYRVEKGYRTPILGWPPSKNTVFRVWQPMGKGELTGAINLVKRGSMSEVRSARPAWYAAYYAAMLESDRQKACKEVEHARKVILDRFAELDLNTPAGAREHVKLKSALAYLDLLASSGREASRVLWC
jgi:hypothetical protein